MLFQGIIFCSSILVELIFQSKFLNPFYKIKNLTWESVGIIQITSLKGGLIND